MTKQKIREIFKANFDQVETLQAVIDSGVEFSDAVWQVSQALRLPPDEVEQLEQDYDKRC